MITSPSHAIDLLGGVNAVSRAIGRRYTTVDSWARRGSIPSKVWPQLVNMAQEHKVEGFTYEALAQAHASAAQRPEAA